MLVNAFCFYKWKTLPYSDGKWCRIHADTSRCWCPKSSRSTALNSWKFSERGTFFPLISFKECMERVVTKGSVYWCHVWVHSKDIHAGSTDCGSWWLLGSWVVVFFVNCWYLFGCLHGWDQCGTCHLPWAQSPFHGSNIRAIFKKGFKRQLLINLMPLHRRSEHVEHVGYCRKTP